MKYKVFVTAYSILGTSEQIDFGITSNLKKTIDWILSIGWKRNQIGHYEVK